jgi:2-C-methyl-D-erythritol 4-phosphate cytidylyltransferase
MNVALLTAAGKGTRMHQDIPKQFIHVDNKPVIIYTMEAFQQHPNIDAIVVVTLDSWSDVLWAYAKQFNITKLRWVVPGGETGQESIYNGLMAIKEAVPDEDDVVMVHDGNRPLVTSEIISDSLATFKKHGNAVAVIPCQEVVFESEDGQSSMVSTEREKLFRTQTPHTYKLDDLIEAHREAQQKGITGTAASCMLMKELGKMSYFSKGSEENIKITTLDDLKIFKALLHTRQDDWLK